MASNDDMRQQFLDSYVPKIRELGLDLPDPNLMKNMETGKWDFSDPDWDEFQRVINGDGPCNAERLATRKFAEEHGKWVREALMNPRQQFSIPLA